MYYQYAHVLKYTDTLRFHGLLHYAHVMRYPVDNFTSIEYSNIRK
jgi:hypothetical protein